MAVHAVGPNGVGGTQSQEAGAAAGAETVRSALTPDRL